MELLVDFSNRRQQIVQLLGYLLKIRRPLLHSHHAGDLGEERADLVLQTSDFCQALLENIGKCQQTKSVTGGSRVENHHAKIKPLNQPTKKKRTSSQSINRTLSLRNSYYTHFITAA